MTTISIFPPNIRRVAVGIFSLLTLLMVVTTVPGYTQSDDSFVQSGTYNGEQTGDLFGNAVAASQDTVAVSAVGYDSSGSLRGRVHLYQRSGDNWSQTASRTYNGAAPMDYFGRSVALSSDGNTLVVGASGFDAGRDDTGLVYIYERVGGVWGTEPTAFYAGAAGEQLGWSVAADRDTVVAGTANGRVYVYTRANGTWNSTPTRTYTTGKPSDRFGHDVGLHDNTLVIGAPDTDVSIERGFAGRAYVYTQVNGTWGADPAVVYDGQSMFDRFGDSVAVHGDSIAVGAYASGDSGTRRGRAYVYQQQGGSWPSAPARVYDGEANFDFFGASVSITQNALLIGAPHHDTNGADTGRVYRYERALGAAWPATPTKVITGENEYDFFGEAVSTAGITSVVGARINSQGGIGNGRAYVYNGEGSNSDTLLATTQPTDVISDTPLPTTASDLSYDGILSELTLVDATANADIGPLSDGDVINLGQLGSREVNVLAQIVESQTENVGSVVFNLSGAETRDWVESLAPYTLFADERGDYNPWTPTLGRYTLSVTVYSQANGSGDVLSSVSIAFDVTDGDQTNPNTAPSLVDAPDNQSNNVGDEVFLELTGTDAEQDPFRFSATGLPTGLSIDSDTGLVSGTVAACAGGNGGAYQEQNGRVAIEMEAASLAGTNWATGTDGDRTYIVWEGENAFSTANQGVLTYPVQFNTPGTYQFVWESVFSGSNSTEENDTWLRIDPPSGGSVTAFFAEQDGDVIYPRGGPADAAGERTYGSSNPGSDGYFKNYRSGSLSWKWQSNTIDNDPYDIFVNVAQPGVYTISVAARSSGHKIDRMQLHLPDQFNSNPSQSATTGSGDASCAYDVNVTVADASNATLFTAYPFTWTVGEGEPEPTDEPTVEPTGEPLPEPTDEPTDMPPTSDALTFTLVNAVANTRIRTLTQGAVIDLTSLETDQLNILVEATNADAVVGSIALELTNSQGTEQAVESLAPYAFFGDSRGDYNRWTPELDTYTLAGTIYEGRSASGSAGASASVTFTFTDGSTLEPTDEPTVEPTIEPTATPTVEPTDEPTIEPTNEPTDEPTPQPTDVLPTSDALTFTLVNAVANTRIRTLTQGAVIDLTSLETDQLNILVEATNADAVVGSIALELTNSQGTEQAVESLAPYAFFGDSQGDYNRWTPELDTYTVAGTIYEGRSASGSAGASASVTFTFTDGSTLEPTDEPTVEPTIEPTVEPTVEPTDEPTPQPTDVPQTSDELTFTLVNAVANTRIRTLTQGAVIDLTSLETDQLNILVEATNADAVVGSIALELTNSQGTEQAIESLAPYAFFGDSRGDYNRWTPELDTYTLAGTIYEGRSASGSAGSSASVTFTFTDGSTLEPTDEPIVEPTVEPTDEPMPEPTATPTIEPTATPTVAPTDEPTPELTEGIVQSFTLIDATTNQPVPGYDPMPLDAQINMSALGISQINIRVNTSGPVNSVLLQMTGPENKNQTENLMPYALYGDEKGDYNGWQPPVGSYTLRGVPYEERNMSGQRGIEHTITFTIQN